MADVPNFIASSDLSHGDIEAVLVDVQTHVENACGSFHGPSSSTLATTRPHAFRCIGVALCTQRAQSTYVQGMDRFLTASHLVWMPITGPLVYRHFIFMLALLVSVVRPSNAGQLLTATCGPLTGTKAILVNGKANTTPESQVAPIFFVDSERPQKLVSLWKSKLFDRETTDKYEATIVELSNEKLQAVELDSNGLYSYTIFLATGMLLYSHHRLRSLFDEGPSLLSFVGKCEIKVGR